MHGNTNIGSFLHGVRQSGSQQCKKFWHNGISPARLKYTPEIRKYSCLTGIKIRDLVFTSATEVLNVQSCKFEAGNCKKSV